MGASRATFGGTEAAGPGWQPLRWLRGLALAITVGCAVGACGGSAPSHPVKSDAGFSDLIGAGTQLMAKGNDAAAAQVFQQAIAKKRTSPVGYYDLGVAYAAQGERHNSLVEYATALTKDKNYVPALYNYGIAFEHRNVPLAMYFFRRVIQLQPDSPSALLNYGLLAYRRAPKARTKALRLLKRAELLEPALAGSIPSDLRARVQATKLPKSTKRAKKRKATS